MAGIREFVSFKAHDRSKSLEKSLFLTHVCVYPKYKYVTVSIHRLKNGKVQHLVSKRLLSCAPPLVRTNGAKPTSIKNLRT